MSQAPHSDKNIIIIGAGISGLAAAKYLKDQGIETIVLEAQDLIGGRVKTNRALGIPFEEGASWIHKPKGNPITLLAQAAGITSFATDDDKVSVFDIDGSTYSDKTLDKAEQKFLKILDNLEGTTDESFGEVFYAKYPSYQNNRLWTYMLSAYLEFDTGGDIYRLSSRDFYDDEEFAGKDVRVSNGFDRLAKHLAYGIDIQLNTKVTAIDYSANKTILTTSQGIFEADFVLLSVPLGVLKKNIIHFTPALPKSKQKAIQKMQMGSVNKFLLVWDKPFWDTDLHYIGYTPETKGKFNYFLNVSTFTDAYALITYSFGDYSLETEKMTDEEIMDEIMAHLQVMYGENIPKPTNMLRTKWNTNEFTFGSYSFATNKTRSKKFNILKRSVADKLFFAGEHTEKNYRATVHGAYLSGVREATKIMKSLKA